MNAQMDVHTIFRIKVSNPKVSLALTVLLIVAILYESFVNVNFFVGTGSFTTQTIRGNGASAGDNADQVKTAEDGQGGSFQYLPCHIMEIGDGVADQQRFQESPVSSWTCRQEVSDTYLLFFVEFQIHECPPNYSSSTFHLEASTNRSRVMGRVGDRYHFEHGCGIYNASVAIFDEYRRPEVDINDPSGTVLTATEVFDMTLSWTSEFRKYSNRIKDIYDAHAIKVNDLNASEIEQMFTEERLNYLTSHLDTLFQKKLQITTNSTTDYPRVATAIDSPRELPECGTIPISHWYPAGVFDHPYNDTSMTQQSEDQQWPYRAARCYIPPKTLDQYNELLAGIRIRSMGDSHGGFLLEESREFTCPEWKSGGDEYFKGRYNCPFRNNTWNYAYRFFRAVYQQDMATDMDGLSANLRHGSDKSCQQFLGLGLHNATIVVVPHWLFVYETNEGVDDFVLAFKSLIINCRKSHEDLMRDHIILLQSPSARDYRPRTGGSNDYDSPAHSWRGIHNFRIDDVTQRLKNELGTYVDGIIPAFEMTLAGLATDRTVDGVHLTSDGYRKLLHVQLAAVQSAFKFKRRLELPIMGQNDPNARWFVDLDFDWHL